MTRSELRPLSKESVTRIELVRAQHEVRIRRVLLDWHAQAERGTARPLTLTMQQQTELQGLVVARSVQLGETEGCERLSATPGPSQFEVEIHFLVEIVADEARHRWQSLTSEFHLEALTEGVNADAERGVCSCVRELLRAPSNRLMLQAWSAYEKQLRAECEGASQPVPSSPAPVADTRPAVPGPRVSADRSETLGRNVERLRIDKGMTIEELALEASVDKKTVIRIIRKGKGATPCTLKKLADAFGVAASDLAS